MVTRQSPIDDVPSGIGRPEPDAALDRADPTDTARPASTAARRPRREFLRSVLAIGGLVAAGGVPAFGATRKGHETPAREDLFIPDEEDAVGFALTCAPARVSLGGGQVSSVLAYNGRFPGPTWVARTGDRATATLVNGLAEETITHWHGVIVDEFNDGGPRYTIAPGKTYQYDFPILQRAALNWYHPHPHMLTGKQVALGLAGAFIIRDEEEDALALPAGPYEVPLIIRDANFDKSGNLVYNPSSTGYTGKASLVNGMRYPKLDVDRGVYRFRVLNGANARLFRLALSNGEPFTLIGNDGGLLETPAEVSDILLGNGERLDLLVDFGALRTGQTVKLRCLDAGWDLLEFVGTGMPGTDYTPPAVLSDVGVLTGPTTPTRTFSFDGMSRINGLRYEPSRIDFRVRRAVTERWRFITGGNAPHPVHVHGASFQVAARAGGRGRLFPWESGWKDTVLLLDRETVDVLIRFEPYTGRYVLHCHKLEHEDMGMMSNFEVVP